MNTVYGRAVDAGVQMHRLSAFGFDRPAPPGFVLGYGAIPTERIEEGLRRFRGCFDG